MKKKKLRKYYWILGIIIVFIILGISYFRPRTKELTVSDEIKVVQEKIDSILKQYPWLTSCNICRFKDFGDEIHLVCPTNGSYTEGSNIIYYEEYNETGVKQCHRIDVWPKYNCTFIKYPKINPIKKSESITIYSNADPSKLFCGAKGRWTVRFEEEEYVKYTVIDVETRRKQEEISERRCNELESRYDKNLCFRCLAIKTHNIEFCERMIDDKYYTAQERKDFCYKEIGVLLNDTLICKKIKTLDFREFCYEDIAIKLLDKSICEEIETDIHKEICLLLVESMISLNKT